MYVRMYVCLGPSWILLECRMGVLERLGCILGTSGERLGASSERPGGTPKLAGDPTWTSGCAENRAKKNLQSHWFDDRFLDAILMPKWAQNVNLALCDVEMHEVHVAVKPSARQHKWNVSLTRRLNFLTIAEDRSIAMRGIDLISECGDLLNQYSPKLYTQT